MYHCHVRFCFAGRRCRAFEIIEGMTPLECFTHEFSECDKPEGIQVSEADVILANLQGEEEKSVLRELLRGAKKGAELILLLEKEQIGSLMDHLPGVTDLWTLPMTDEEVRFRFFKWQQDFKISKDYWQTSHFLDATINHVPNLVWYKTKDGVHEKVNDSFCQTVNKTKKQVEGQRHAYIWDVEQDDPACIESEREVMTKKKTFVSEETVLTGDGVRLLETYKSPLYDLDGSVMGTVGVAIDVTQERAYEQEIMKKSRTLELIFTSMDCGIMSHSIDGSKIISVNDAALKILGYESQEDLLEDGFDMVASSVVDEDKERLREYIRSLKGVGDNVSMEYRVRHKSGEIIHVMGNVKILEENGERFYQRFLLDCTAQKLQEKKKEQRQMEMIHALSIDYNYVCFYDLDTGAGIPLRVDDGDGRIFETIFDGRCSLKESMESFTERFVHEEDQEMLRQAGSLKALEQELSEKKVYNINYRIWKDGEMKYFQMKAVRAGEWEENRGIVLGFRSVDEEIRNEMEQKSLLEDALMQANRANKAKSAFLSNMSHDIRTPMNAIVGFTTLAIAHIDRQEQVEEYLKKIMTSGNHLLSLINDVLDMSRIESGKMHLEEKPCSLPDILQGLRNIVQTDVYAKQLDLYVDAVDVLDEEIFCDKLRLNQVLLNLLSNCVKYTPAGGLIIMRIQEKADAPAGYANYEFSIRDTGVGMSEEFVRHIFEPFEREKNTTISGIQGTGLGMAITKNIVDMMNGTIEVKSK
ncbi:MAG: PAS domain S-box protein, partial [Lachnospiraceae bacterium]|nr:PAS domain S-box protein [Lachnospiraceae bacterium]